MTAGRASSGSRRLSSLGAAVCAVALVAVAPAIDRASSATPKPSVCVAPDAVKRGKAITATGRNWPRRVTVQLLIGPPRSEAEHVATARTTSRGTFRRTFVPPAWAQKRLGRWIVLACRRDCRVKATASFRLIR